MLYPKHFKIHLNIVSIFFSFDHTKFSNFQFPFSNCFSEFKIIHVPTFQSILPFTKKINIVIHKFQISLHNLFSKLFLFKLKLKLVRCFTKYIFCPTLHFCENKFQYFFSKTLPTNKPKPSNYQQNQQQNPN